MNMPTKKDFEFVAVRIADVKTKARTEGEENLLRDLAVDFAKGFERKNPRFDSGRFLRACGFEP